MNIILFDDQQPIIDMLSAYFKNSTDYKVADTFTKSKDMLNFLKKNTVDVIISDLLTDEELGTDLISMLRKNAPNSIIILYSAITLDFIKESCINAGADLCVSKYEHIDTLHQGIQDILNARSTETEIPIKKKIYHMSLTLKERTIIECMIKGMSSQEIADKLGLSPNTINNQKNHMIKKFDCNNSTELIAKLFRHGFLKV
ncbi:MAG TPA: response regulator transcription factor [Saprospiraceae bacterium]|nr:response regulator transcription factor [Saprospiraceae bacterium]HMU03481.1 response regulator transcription factor [Saprospiraceae bacterium]